MLRPLRRPILIDKALARRIWLRAQRLDVEHPFGVLDANSAPDGRVAAVTAAVEHLGYVQIDTIAVIERCHHHMLWTRIPGYRRADLHYAQSVQKTVFEYWTHALSFVPTRDIRYFLPAMKRHRETDSNWFGTVSKRDIAKVMARIRTDGPISIRDIDDDVLIEKNHAWASRKPSKKAMQKAFYEGRLAISERQGMLKTYELIERHFGWEAKPKPASERQVLAYTLERAVRSQGVVSLDSICHLSAATKPAIAELIETEVRQKRLVPVAIEEAEKVEHWVSRAALEQARDGSRPDAELIHILSPFDPLIIQRKRLSLFFGYDHVFEAYVPKAKRVFGYFALPVLVGDRIVAVLDIKADRAAKSLDIRKWSWINGGNRAEHGAGIEAALDRFAAFQFGD